MSFVRPVLIVVAVVASLSGTARAVPSEHAAPLAGPSMAVCEETMSAEPTLPLPVPNPEPPVVEPVAAPAGPVVPCAMIESGLLGPSCADAAFYVVTQAGVLLCTVDLDTLAVQQNATPAVDRAPPTPVASTSVGLVASALVPDGVAVPPCGVRDLPVAALEHRAVRMDRSDRPPVPPS